MRDKDKIRASMTSIKLNALRNTFTYSDPINIRKISHLPYYDNFENIILRGMYDIDYSQHAQLPANVKHIYAYHRTNDTYIPQFITHLTYGYLYDGLSKKTHTRLIIPSSVTHLTFGFGFNEPIYGCIPYGVTHLTLGPDFNQPIVGYIPTSVTHLTLGKSFDQSLENISASVVHLVVNKI
jgi:hypothetical protein